MLFNQKLCIDSSAIYKSSVSALIDQIQFSPVVLLCSKTTNHSITYLIPHRRDPADILANRLIKLMPEKALPNRRLTERTLLKNLNLSFTLWLDITLPAAAEYLVFFLEFCSEIPDNCSLHSLYTCKSSENNLGSFPHPHPL